jgi:hypothetical protein
MTNFIRTGKIYRTLSGKPEDVTQNLPSQTYLLRENTHGFYFEVADDFKQPEKIYGDCLKHSSRIINTFRCRKRNTGVMLVGEQGSGKTLLARQICIDSGMPTIIVNSPLCGDSFNSLLTSITQPCIILLDEFEKVYHRDLQEKLLSLLDGTFQSEKLFLFTSNDKWGLHQNLKNRPGRIHYLLEFSGVSEDFIREYCQDNLSDKSRISDVIDVSLKFDSFSFDMLAAIVQEMNMYNDSVKDLLRILNVRPEYSGRTVYSVKNLEFAGKQFNVDRTATVEVNVASNIFSVYANIFYDEGSLSNSEEVSIFGSDEADFHKFEELVISGVIRQEAKNSEEEESRCLRIRFYPEDIIKMEGSTIYYFNEDKFSVNLIKSNRRAGRFYL